MTGTDIWQCSSYRVTISDAVAEFSRVYWAQPRKHTKLQEDGTFRMVRGIATYQCRYVDGAFPLWVIAKLEDEDAKKVEEALAKRPRCVECQCVLHTPVERLYDKCMHCRVDAADKAAREGLSRTAR